MKKIYVSTILVLTLLGLVGLAAAPAPTRDQAQEKTASRMEGNPSAMITRTFTLKYIRPERMAANLRNLYRDQVRTIIEGDMLIVRTWPVLMEPITQLVAELDTARQVSPDVEILVYLLYASPAQDTDESIPTVLQPAVDQLKKTFAFKGYRLLDTIIMRAGTADDAKKQVKGSFRWPLETDSDIKQGDYLLSVQRITLRQNDTPVQIGLDALSLECSYPAPTGRGFFHHGFDLVSDISLKEGQLAVLGKTSDGTPNALVAVVTARVIR